MVNWSHVRRNNLISRLRVARHPLTKIAVDCQISGQTVNQLDFDEFKVVQRAYNMPDEQWVAKALEKGAEFIVSPDSDIPAILKRIQSTCLWIRLPQGLTGREQFSFIKKSIERSLKRKNTKPTSQEQI